MAKQTAIIRTMFFVETDVFQRLSQWEKAMMDFYAKHGVDMERVNVYGAENTEQIYVLKSMDKVDKAQVRPKQTSVQDKLKQMRKEVKK